MKKILLCTLFMGFITGYAQNGLYLEPGLGIGTANVKTNVGHASISSVTHYGVQAAIGYQKNKWRIESGLRYFTSGFKSKDNFLFENFMPVNTIWGGLDFNNILTYTHFEIPLKVGYQIKLWNKLSVVPMVGVAVSYNVKAHSITDYSGHIVQSVDLSAKEFDERYNRYSVWQIFRVNLEYKASKRTSFLLGFQTDYMLTSMFAKNEYYSEYKQNNYALSLNAGMRWNIKSQRNYQ